MYDVLFSVLGFFFRFDHEGKNIGKNEEAFVVCVTLSRHCGMIRCVFFVERSRTKVFDYR